MVLKIVSFLHVISEQVRAIIVSDEARTEANLDKNLGGLLKTSEDIFVSQVTLVAPTVLCSYLDSVLISRFQCQSVI
jgi:hypothetical protein